MFPSFPTRAGVRLAALAAIVCCAAASARADELALYGYFDLGVVKESGAAPLLDRGLNNFLGVRGSEDLGGATKLTFDAQMRFNPDSGAPERGATLFQGETTLGLKNARLGHLRLGRAMTPLWQEKWRYEPWYDSAFMGSLEAYNGDFNSDGLAGTQGENYSRAGNSVFYGSPAMAGFSVSAMLELETAPGAARRARGATLGYAGGPVTALLAYEKNHVDDDIVYAAASYRIERLSLMASYSRTRLALAAGSRHSAMLAGTYDLAGGTARFGYGRVDGDGAHKLSVGYMHALSKRSNLYADLYRETRAASTNGLALGLNHSF
ncbi:porin [Janthinobacterium sp.]|uniref:porin n=1 Tax=Janthinobacterium sp. TaxID=1871054 RepID=UPI00293D3261|nr:porin [Janthinobacterium sp.]